MRARIVCLLTWALSLSVFGCRSTQTFPHPPSAPSAFAWPSESGVYEWQVEREPAGEELYVAAHFGHLWQLRSVHTSSVGEVQVQLAVDTRTRWITGFSAALTVDEERLSVDARIDGNDFVLRYQGLLDLERRVPRGAATAVVLPGALGHSYALVALKLSSEITWVRTIMVDGPQLEARVVVLGYQSEALDNGCEQVWVKDAEERPVARFGRCEGQWRPSALEYEGRRARLRD